MARINLLPWREAERARKKKDYLMTLAGVAGLAVLGVVLAQTIIGQMQDNQRQRNQYLQNEIAKLEIQIREIRDIKEQRAHLLKRIEVIQQLQQQRHLPVQVLNELARVMVPGVYLTRLEVSGDRVAIEGYCESNNHLANMMREVEQAQWLTKPQVHQIVAASSAPKKEHVFKLDVTVLEYGNGPLADEQMALKGGRP